MSGLAGGLCRGQGPLFESVDLADHHEAASICADCPAISACDALLAEQYSTLAGYGGGPVGTWAGQLVGTKAKAREHGTERGWGQHRHYRERVCQDCRMAHNQHVRKWKKAQVNPTNRTPERVGYGAESGPESALTDRGLATISTTAKGA